MKKFRIEKLLFPVGIILFLIGMFLLFGTALKEVKIFKKIFDSFSADSIFMIKIVGAILFVVGFITFIIALVMLYKNNYILEKNRDLIVEGKADVITLVVMIFVELFMLVLCLFFDEIIGALLFGVTLVIQTIVNTILIKYFGKGN